MPTSDIYIYGNPNRPLRQVTYMGNIRPTYIKRSAMELIKRYPDRLTDDFEQNKKVLSEIAHFQSQSLRNKVAGYIIRRRKVLQRME